MTRPIQPGRELDAWLAVHLFGWRWCATDGGHYSESMDGGKKGSYIKARVRRFLSPGWNTGKHADRWKELNTVECTEADMALPIGYSYYPDGPRISYSTTWEGMRLIVEAMEKLGWGFYLGIDNGSADAAFWRVEKEVIKFDGEADIAPGAVALAAVEAIGGTAR